MHLTTKKLYFDPSGYTLQTCISFWAGVYVLACHWQLFIKHCKSSNCRISGIFSLQAHTPKDLCAQSFAFKMASFSSLKTKTIMTSKHEKKIYKYIVKPKKDDTAVMRLSCGHALMTPVITEKNKLHDISLGYYWCYFKTNSLIIERKQLGSARHSISHFHRIETCPWSKKAWKFLNLMT